MNTIEESTAAKFAISDNFYMQTNEEEKILTDDRVGRSLVKV